MEAKVHVMIYGDSLMKGIVADDTLRYHATMASRLKEMQRLFPLEFTNRARFGITVEKGMEYLMRDIAAGALGDYTLLEFGGNDCDFRWETIAAAPEGEYIPATPISRFREVLLSMVEALRRAGSTPILMTLPPIDACRYLQFISRGGICRENILRWLGDTAMIYRFHEAYSNAVAHVAVETGALLADIRSFFLTTRTYSSLIGPDGIHLTSAGYGLMAEAFHAFINSISRSAPSAAI